ncbi:MAG TPA: ADP-ribosylation factor-like protein, partial [Candidatus Polarisedimenticolaceae bacterium]|nr:ADP-ribosylation factor-like protein [Candidatus Polarisedimenticolaceae bacterium]
MALWSRADRTLHAKIVYYGPALGGKTTNLEVLHRITDPQRTTELLSIKTAEDRTLFFDLLPFDFGEILGHQVAIKLYTVPGQVRYEASRRVVLAGVDAVIFVADSSANREEQNRWSLQNLVLNMRANRIEPAAVPLVYQFNKQDLPDAQSPEQVARSLGIPAGRGVPAVAREGRGVLETFGAACHA